MTEQETALEVYQRFNLRLVYWRRVGDDPNTWKGPGHDSSDKGWNDSERTYDLRQFDPSIHNIGTCTGHEIAEGKYLVDIDVDKLNQCFAIALLPPTGFRLRRRGKPLSHLLYTTPTQLQSRRQYKALSDNKPYIELRGTKFQTMLPPSLHHVLPEKEHIEFIASDYIGHYQLEFLDNAVIDYAIASLVNEALPGGLHHDERLALAGYLLKHQFDEQRVVTLLQTICAYQVECRVPDMSKYDVTDSKAVVETTVERLKNQEQVAGSKALSDINADLLKRLRSWMPRVVGPVGLEDFYAFMPTHTYFFIPSREFWPAASVNARIPPVGDAAASVWLDRHRSVEQLVWAPGQPLLVPDRLVAEGGWIEHPGCACVNLYREPQVTLGDAALAGPWVSLVEFVYPQDAGHIIMWLAHRVQRPHEKINHALVLGGAPGIGKDTMLEPIKTAIGPWNFAEVNPTQVLGRFNGFLKSIILRVSEARDLGEFNRYDFYEHMKTYTAAPPDVLRVDEKNIKEYAVFNVTGIIHTTNYETNGLYLPHDDRRHYVAWSTRTSADFANDYWNTLYGWYADGGRGHVAAYLSSFNLSQFDPKAPPPKTEAFWAIVNANRPVEDVELADVIDDLGKPPVLTLRILIDALGEEPNDLKTWLADRKNTRTIPHRMKTAGYVPHRNKAAIDGLWKINRKRQAVYVLEELTEAERAKLVGALGGN
jgi:hypothetical protein